MAVSSSQLMARPYAGCPKCAEPLIGTFEVPQKEFVCIICGTYYAFLSPMPLDVTPERDARYAELKALFDKGVRNIGETQSEA